MTPHFQWSSGVGFKWQITKNVFKISLSVWWIYKIIKQNVRLKNGVSVSSIIKQTWKSDLKISKNVKM